MSKASPYSGLHHVSLLVSDLERASDFYKRVLGLENDRNRPDMTFSGIWLNIGSQQIHLICLDMNSLVTVDEHPGRSAHFAISVDNIDKIAEKLAQEEIAFYLSNSGRRALFCRDPDGNAIEFVEQIS